MNPILSVIIPCYNSASTLAETLDSVLNMDFKDWEAIMVNDGSPDNLETIALAYAEKDKRFRYFKKENGGLGSARNFGVEKSLGAFVLPLDSDNKIRPNFVKKALNVFQADNAIGVVYGDAQYFGEKTGRRIVGDFDPLQLLSFNYIDACAIIRKSVFEKTEGYERNIPYQGHEDWEFWLQVMNTDYKFHYLNEITYDYRVLNTSMIRSFSKEMENANVRYIMDKHYKLYLKYYPKLYSAYNSLKIEQSLSLKKRISRKLKKWFK